MPRTEQTRSTELKISINFCDESCFSAVRAILDECNLTDPERDTPECFAKKIAKDPGSIFVARDQTGAIAGTVFTVSDGWAAFIFRLAVLPSFRGIVDINTGKTVGLALMEAAEQRLRTEGARDIGIIVNDELVSLKNWYEKQGYKQTGMYRFMWKNSQEQR